MQTSVSEKTLADHLFGWWYAIATPPPPADNAPLRLRESLAKIKFVSIILLIEIILSVADLATGFAYGYGARLFIPITVSIAAMVAGVVLNRLDKTIAATVLVLEWNMGSFVFVEFFSPGGAHTANIIASIILMQPSIIAASVLAVPIALSVGSLNVLFTLALMIWAPKSAEILNLPPGSYFNACFVPLSTHVVIILLNIYWTNSMHQEMNRANRAEEVNGLIEELAGQQQLALAEKQRLEESIQQIVHVHTQVANGDLNARVPLDQGNVLWLIAGSLNNLLSRLQRSRHDAKNQKQTEQAIQYLILALQTAKRQGTQINVQKTGTPIDHLIAEMLNDPSFARPDHIRPELARPELRPDLIRPDTPLPEISSSWPDRFR